MTDETIETAQLLVRPLTIYCLIFSLKMRTLSLYIYFQNLSHCLFSERHAKHIVLN